MVVRLNRWQTTVSFWRPMPFPSFKWVFHWLTVICAATALLTIPPLAPNGLWLHVTVGWLAIAVTARGEFALVNVCATWCPPCRKEMPSLDRLEKAFVGNPNIKVIAISVDRTSIAQVRAFYYVTGIEHLPLLHGSEDEVLPALQIAGLPTTLLLDRRGLEIGRLYGPTAWDNTAMIEQLWNLVGTE